MSAITWPSGVQGGTFGTREQRATLDDRYEGFLRPPALEPVRNRVLDAWPETLAFGDGTFPLLPSSVARVTALVERHQDGAVALVGSKRLTEVLDTAPLNDASTLVVSVPGPGEWRAALQQSQASTVIARVRAPFDAWWRRVVETCTVVEYVRDAEHYLAPGPFVLDGGGDHWVVRDIGKARWDSPGLPLHTYRDFDGLDANQSTAAQLSAFVERIGERWSAPIASTSVIERDETIAATQSHEDGSTFTAELRPVDGHLLLTFPAYNSGFETTVLGTVYEFFGTEMMRSRPVRTRWAPEEMVF
ncbi:MAG: hypothetical protein AAF654_02965 [Myxococcota bacterium]